MQVITKKQNKSAEYLNDLWECGRRSYSDLSPEEAKRLAGFIMLETNSSSDQLEFITEAKNYKNMLSDFIGYMISFDQFPEIHEDSRERFLESISNGAIQYARRAIEKMFLEKEEEIEMDEKFDRYNKDADMGHDRYVEQRL